MIIAIGNDHTGVGLKKELRLHLEQKGIKVIDFGTDSEESSNYPSYAKKVCRAILAGEVERGVLICGTGIGMSLAANKMHRIRAVVCSEPYSAVLSRKHNNTNVLCLGARVVGVELAKMILDLWLEAEYEGGRHQTRLDMITEIENQ